MGRVLTLRHGTGLGGRLLKEGISQIRTRMRLSKIYIEAQCYAVGFYEKEGFQISSEEFLEDGIPHVQMVLEFGWFVTNTIRIVCRPAGHTG